MGRVQTTGNKVCSIWGKTEKQYLLGQRAGKHKLGKQISLIKIFRVNAVEQEMLTHYFCLHRKTYSKVLGKKKKSTDVGCD